ncbi:hypothetical protein ACA910_009478 [Epithemia clementina (nom. ined.)]
MIEGLQDNEDDCLPCNRLFYELHFNLSLPCARRSLQHTVIDKASQQPFEALDIETTCLSVPRESHYASDEKVDSGLDAGLSATIERLVFLELDVDFAVRAQKTVHGSFFAGQSILYESFIPAESRGMQVIATAVDDAINQESIVRSWTFYSQQACIPSPYWSVSVGWAKTIVACSRYSPIPQVPTPSPVRLPPSSSGSKRPPVMKSRSNDHIHVRSRKRGHKKALSSD